MAHTQHIQYGRATTIYYYPTERPSSATVSVYTGDGGQLFTATAATLASGSTTLNGAVTRGATSIIVTSASNFAVGDRFWLRTPDEECRIKAISSTTFTLWAPLVNGHATGVTVEKTKLSYAVTAAQSTTTFWDGRAEWIMTMGDASTRIRHTSVVCTAYPFYRSATLEDARIIEPKIEQLLADEIDPEAWLDNALEDVLKRVGAVQREWVYTGPECFNKATIFAGLVTLYRRRPGAAAKELYERYMNELEAELDRVVAVVPRDLDQDGAISADDKRSFRSVDLYRR